MASPLKYVLTLLILSASCFASDIYYAQSLAGSNNGTNCANAYAITRFNSITGADWTAGNTLHLCGTVTSTLTVQASGSAGNTTTIKFETNAKLSAGCAPTSNAWILPSSNSYLLIDGGSNGIIENTASGTGLGCASMGGAIGDGACGHDIEIKNLTIQNIYVRISNAVNTTDGANSGDIVLLSCGSNISVHNNTLTQAQSNLLVSVSNASVSNWTFYSNTMVGSTWGINAQVSGSGTISGIKIHDNDINCENLWQDATFAFHIDGIFVFGQGGGGGAGSITASQVYNNYIHGDFGLTATAFIYINQNVDHFNIFNNLLTSLNGIAGNGTMLVGFGADTFRILNNTFVGAGPSTGGQAFAGTTLNTNTTYENNVFVHFQGAMLFTTTATFTALDHNDYFDVSGTGVTNIWQIPALSTSVFATWQGGGNDVNGSVGDPKLSGTFIPQSGSAAIGLGANLTSLSIAALDLDAPLCFGNTSCSAGTARPASAAWPAGAYQLVASNIPGSSIAPGVSFTGGISISRLNLPRIYCGKINGNVVIPASLTLDSVLSFATTATRCRPM